MASTPIIRRQLGGDEPGKQVPGREAKRHVARAGSADARRPTASPAPPAGTIGWRLSRDPARTYEHFAWRDPLATAVPERMLAGVSCRRCRGTQEPVGEEVEAEATSRSLLARAFVERTREALHELMGWRLDDVRTAILMLDGSVLAACSSGLFPLPPYDDSACNIARERMRTSHPDISHDDDDRHRDSESKCQPRPSLSAPRIKERTEDEHREYGSCRSPRNRPS